MSEALPQPGDVLYVGGAASVQFEGDRALTFRVIQPSASIASPIATTEMIRKRKTFCGRVMSSIRA